MSEYRSAFYARPGSIIGDLLALLHPPYTLWHLSYVAIGAGLAPEVDLRTLLGTLAAFAAGLGVGAHAFDEFKGRPLGTRIPDPVLLALGTGGMALAMGVAALGVATVSPWVMVWAGVGVLLASAYALEWAGFIHSDLGFALAWGAFPVLAGHWAQTLSLSPATGVAAGAAVLLSLVQRSLSTPARFVRRQVSDAETRFQPAGRWSRAELLETWERPLALLVGATTAIAAALLLRHL